MTNAMGVEIVDNTFFEDFATASLFGQRAIRETYDRCIESWRGDAHYMAALVLALNQLCWLFASKGRDDLGRLYESLFFEAEDAFWFDADAGRFSEEEVAYFFSATD